MGFSNKYPYTDFHELNADWLLETVKDAADTAESMDGRVTSIEAALPGMASSISDLTAGLGRTSSAVTTLTGTVDTLSESMIDAQADITNLGARTAINEGDIDGLDTRVTALENTGSSTSGIVLLFDSSSDPVSFDGRISYSWLAAHIKQQNINASLNTGMVIVLKDDNPLKNTVLTLTENHLQDSGNPNGVYTFSARTPYYENGTLVKFINRSVVVSQGSGPSYSEVDEYVLPEVSSSDYGAYLAVDANGEWTLDVPSTWTDIQLYAGANTSLVGSICMRNGNQIIFDVFLNITGTTAPGEALVTGFPALETLTLTSRLATGRYLRSGSTQFSLYFCGVTDNLNCAYSLNSGDELRVWGTYWL